MHPIGAFFLFSEAVDRGRIPRERRSCEAWKLRSLDELKLDRMLPAFPSFLTS
jgi:hypothetical protein